MARRSSKSARSTRSTRSTKSTKSTQPTSDIEKLLDERQTIGAWLDRLGQAADETPDDVRDKVRSDYEGRLAVVVEELEGYSGELRAALAEQTEKRSALSELEEEAEQRLSEAKLRHAVGEYDESKWNEIQSDSRAELVEVRADLKACNEEIHNLKDVLFHIDAASTPQVVELEDVEDLEDVEAVPAGDLEQDEGEGKAGQTEAFDELAFLKSVGGQEGPPPRRSASFAAADQKVVSQADGSPAVDASADEAEPDDDAPAGQGDAKKTLKCAECGTMNLPTEWYCESCGAELTNP